MAINSTFQTLSLLCLFILSVSSRVSAEDELSVGPMVFDETKVPPSDYKSQVLSYFRELTPLANNDELPSYKLTDPQPFRLFDTSGFLICVTVDDNKNILRFPGPYAFMFAEQGLFQAGGAYLCNLDELSASNNTEYYRTHAVAPRMTRSMSQAGESGVVVLEFSVDRKGRTQNIAVIMNSTENEAFAKASIKAVDQFRYSPRIISGKKYSVDGVRQSFRFGQ